MGNSRQRLFDRSVGLSVGRVGEKKGWNWNMKSEGHRMKSVSRFQTPRETRQVRVVYSEWTTL